MELSDLVPLSERKKEGWVIKSGYLMYSKLNLIPIAFISEGQVYVVLDWRIKNKVISLIKHLVNNDIHFFLTIEEVTNPTHTEDLNEKIIEQHIRTYLYEGFYQKFEDIEFDLMGRLVEWSKKEDCFRLIKEVIDAQINRYESGGRYSETHLEKASKLRTAIRHIQIAEIFL